MHEVAEILEDSLGKWMSVLACDNLKYWKTKVKDSNFREKKSYAEKEK